MGIPRPMPFRHVFRPFCAILAAFSLVMQAPMLASAEQSQQSAVDWSKIPSYYQQTPPQQAANSAFAPAADDPTAQRCDMLADPPYDPEKAGNGVDDDDIDTSGALPVCQEAAAAQPVRPRYQYLYGRVLMAANREQEGAQQVIAAAQAGFPVAMADVGILCATGEGVEKNPQTALAWLRQAANTGLPVAYFDLGVYYSNGDAVEADYSEAAQWFKKAGDAGYADGYAELGTLYITGDPPNYATAAAWFQKGAQEGSADGAMWLGWLYSSGQGVQQNLAMALQLYTQAANAGSTDAAYRVGMIYRYGRGVQPDATAAAQWFYKAAKQGHTKAEAELGYMFYEGAGTKQSDTAALAWFTPAAQAGLPMAEDGLALLSEVGKGIEHNPTTAVQWYEKAAGQQDVFAMYELGMHLRLGSGIQWDEGAAMQWFRKAADQQFGAAEGCLGYGYMNGLGGGTQDYQQAAYWFGRAVQHGDSYSLLWLGQLYDNGWGVQQDQVRAKQLYSQAANDPNPQVSDLGKKMVSMMPDTPDGYTAQQAPPRDSGRSNDSWVGPAIVIGGGILLLSALFSSHGSSGAATSAEPSGGMGGSMSMSSDTSGGWGGGSSTSSAPTPVCHQVPVETAFQVQSGTCAVMPTNCGYSGATTMVCD
ncbi:MAG TPA: SEL1-like repeat protein [Candidatus Acidoferrum sp.]|nr:SEL1-like repeat protein [Candidatus Acidoferrum sp.]